MVLLCNTPVGIQDEEYEAQERWTMLVGVFSQKERTRFSPRYNPVLTSIVVGALRNRTKKMKRQILTIVMLLITVCCFAQKKTISRDEFLFEQGLLLQEMLRDRLTLDDVINSNDTPKSTKELAVDVKEAILNKAIGRYKELIDSFPKSKLLFRALNNKGFAELALDNTFSAKKTFQRILASTADDKERGGIGSGLMGEPFANYKNRAAKTLANISLHDSDYKEALKFLDETKKYPYRHFCGNEAAEDRLYMVELYAKCYIGLNDDRKALEILLPHLLPNGLANNSDLVDLAYNTLLKKHKREELKTEYEAAFKTYSVEKTKTKYDEYESYYITFLGVKIELESWRLVLTKQEDVQKEIDDMCIRSRFYKLLTE